VQVPPGSRPMRAMDIIYVDTPSGKAVEKSSSYNLSIFSSGADSEVVMIVLWLRVKILAQASGSCGPT
jgi:hypothetical protein